MRITEVLALVERRYVLNESKRLYNFRSTRKRIESHIGELAASDLSAARIDEFRHDLLKDGLKQATINDYMSVLRVGFAEAVRYELVPYAPTFPAFKIGTRNARQGFFEAEDVGPLLECLSHLPHAKLMAAIALFSGMRKGEIQHLRWEEVRPDGIYLHANETKARKARKIPMNERLQAHLARARHLPQAPDGRVVHRNGEQYGGIWKPFRRACDIIGKPGMSIHDCRRSFARWLIRAGNDPDTVCRILGWASVQMLSRYNIISDRDIVEASGRLDRYFDAETAPVKTPKILTA